jgi:hypothetical protein
MCLDTPDNNNQIKQNKNKTKLAQPDLINLQFSIPDHTTDALHGSSQLRYHFKEYT